MLSKLSQTVTTFWSAIKVSPSSQKPPASIAEGNSSPRTMKQSEHPLSDSLIQPMLLNAPYHQYQGNTHDDLAQKSDQKLINRQIQRIPQREVLPSLPAPSMSPPKPPETPLQQVQALFQQPNCQDLEKQLWKILEPALQKLSTSEALDVLLLVIFELYDAAKEPELQGIFCQLNAFSRNNEERAKRLKNGLEKKYLQKPQLKSKLYEVRMMMFGTWPDILDHKIQGLIFPARKKVNEEIQEVYKQHGIEGLILSIETSLKSQQELGEGFYVLNSIMDQYSDELATYMNACFAKEEKDLTPSERKDKKIFQQFIHLFLLSYTFNHPQSWVNSLTEVTEAKQEWMQNLSKKQQQELIEFCHRISCMRIKYSIKIDDQLMQKIEAEVKNQQPDLLPFLSSLKTLRFQNAHMELNVFVQNQILDQLKQERSKQRAEYSLKMMFDILLLNRTLLRRSPLLFQDAFSAQYVNEEYQSLSLHDRQAVMQVVQEHWEPLVAQGKEFHRRVRQLPVMNQQGILVLRAEIQDEDLMQDEDFKKQLLTIARSEWHWLGEKYVRFVTLQEIVEDALQRMTLFEYDWCRKLHSLKYHIWEKKCLDNAIRNYWFNESCALNYMRKDVEYSIYNEWENTVMKKGSIEKMHKHYENQCQSMIQGAFLLGVTFPDELVRLILLYKGLEMQFNYIEEAYRKAQSSWD